jgi:hypothetical protein
METTNKEVSSLLSLQQSLQNQREALTKRLAVVDDDLKAVNTTLRLLRNGHSAGSDQPVKILPLFSSSPKIDLGGMTQLKALVAIALSNPNGSVKITEARKALEKAGVLKRTKNGYNILYNVITKSGKFSRCSPGEYKLLSEFEQMINRVAAGEDPSALIDEVLQK